MMCLVQGAIFNLFAVETRCSILLRQTSSFTLSIISFSVYDRLLVF